MAVWTKALHGNKRVPQCYLIGSTVLYTGTIWGHQNKKQNTKEHYQATFYAVRKMISEKGFSDYQFSNMIFPSTQVFTGRLLGGVCTLYSTVHCSTRSLLYVLRPQRAMQTVLCKRHLYRQSNCCTMHIDIFYYCTRFVMTKRHPRTVRKSENTKPSEHPPQVEECLMKV